MDAFKVGAAKTGMIDQTGERDSRAGRRDITAGFTIAVLRLETAEAQIPQSVLLEATRAAGAFQRSALGYLDHQGWSDRVRSDGQRLINVLTEIGFHPARTANSK